jgi:hypothetical protein
MVQRVPEKEAGGTTQKPGSSGQRPKRPSVVISFRTLILSTFGTSRILQSPYRAGLGLLTAA